MSKLSKEKSDELSEHLAKETVKELLDIVNGRIEELVDKGVPMKYGVYFAKACGFAISSTSLAFFDDDEMDGAAKQLIMEFANHIGQTVSLNKGISETSNLTLQ